LRITEIRVNKLFGVFDHAISLKNDCGITIIIGENGLGKTVILEAVNAFFDADYNFFNSLVFDSFHFYFNNGDVWELTKRKNPDEHLLFIRRTAVENISKKTKPIKISSISRTSRKRSKDLDMSSHYLFDQYSTSIDENEIRERYRFNELRHLYMNSILDEREKITPPKWFSDGIDKINIKLIETQRIITIKERGSDAYVNNVNKCSNELVGMILNATKESSAVTSALDRTYPNRLIEKLRQGTDDSFEELNNALAKLEERRKLLSSVGLVIDIQDSNLLQLDENQKDLINLLKLYIDDSHKKLDPFEGLSKKIQLYKEIINKRFKHKNLEIDQEDGIGFQINIC